MKNKKVLVQGWGNVGASAAYYLAKSNFNIVGIIDKDGGLINKEGFSFEEIKTLWLKRNLKDYDALVTQFKTTL